jgi:hypothetical protein
VFRFLKAVGSNDTPFPSFMKGREDYNVTVEIEMKTEAQLSNISIYFNKQSTILYR